MSEGAWSCWAHLGVRHAGGKPAQYVGDGDAHVPDRRASAALPGSIVMISL